ncbi:hypothetical protein ACOSQ2_009843 [Xanthoceras sorbifolium]
MDLPSIEDSWRSTNQGKQRISTDSTWCDKRKGKSLSFVVRGGNLPPQVRRPSSHDEREASGLLWRTFLDL